MDSARKCNDLPLIFLFVNPTSGGNSAGKLLAMGVDTMVIRDPGFECELTMHDIRTGKSGEKPGFLKLKECLSSLQPPNSVTRLIVAGGDGSVMWAMSEVIAHGIDMSQVAFGVVPFGTGNDFARSLGWGASTPGGDIGSHNMQGLKSLIRSWLQASICDFDLWDVSIQVDGMIQQVKNKKKKILTNEEGENVQVLHKPMCNYFSIGIESRIGLGFDRNRKQSTLMNKVMYGWEGFKKSFTHTPRIKELVETVVSEREIFNSEKCKGSPVSLIFTNIDSFASGCDLWGRSTRTAMPDLLPEAKRTLKTLPQQNGDGKLEILTYNSLMGLSAEQLRGGFGRRVSQEQGPLQIRFRPDIGDKRCYVQIDGEFFSLNKPTHAEIKHSHTVKVLMKV